jgi:hypothetical protein
MNKLTNIIYRERNSFSFDIAFAVFLVLATALALYVAGAW